MGNARRTTPSGRAGHTRPKHNHASHSKQRTTPAGGGGGGGKSTRRHSLNDMMHDVTVYDPTDPQPPHHIPRAQQFYTNKSAHAVIHDLHNANVKQRQYLNKQSGRSQPPQQHHTLLQSRHNSSKFDPRNSRRDGPALFDMNVLRGLTTSFVSAGYLNGDVKHTYAEQNTLTVTHQQATLTSTSVHTITPQPSITHSHTVDCNHLNRPVKPLHNHKQPILQQQPQSGQQSTPLNRKQCRRAQRNARAHADLELERDLNTALSQHKTETHASEQLLDDSSEDDAAYYSRNNEHIQRQIDRAEKQDEDAYINRIAQQLLDDGEVVEESEDGMLERAIQASMMDYKSANQWQDIVTITSSSSDDGCSEEHKHSSDDDDDEQSTEPLFTIDTDGTLPTDGVAGDDEQPLLTNNAMNDSSLIDIVSVNIDSDDALQPLLTESSTASNDDSENTDSDVALITSTETSEDDDEQSHGEITDNELYDAVDNDDDVAVLYSTYSPVVYAQTVPTDVADAFPIDLTRDTPLPDHAFGAASWSTKGKIAHDDTVQSDDSGSEYDYDDMDELSDDDDSIDDMVGEIDEDESVDIDDVKLSRRDVLYPTPGGTTKLRGKQQRSSRIAVSDSGDSMSDADELYGNIDQCTCPPGTVFDISAVNKLIYNHFIGTKSKANLVLEPSNNRFYRMQCHSLAELYGLNSYSTDSNDDSNQRYTTLKHTSHTSTPPHKILQLFMQQCKVKNVKLLKQSSRQYGCLMHSHMSVKKAKGGQKGGGMSVGKLMSKLNKKMNMDKYGSKRVTAKTRRSDMHSRGKRTGGGGGGGVSQSDSIVVQQASSRAAKPIDDSNVGSRMLRLLGWSDGAGLGRQSRGIVVPILPTLKFNKRGVGAE